MRTPARARRPRATPSSWARTNAINVLWVGETTSVPDSAKLSSGEPSSIVVSTLVGEKSAVAALPNVTTRPADAASGCASEGASGGASSRLESAEPMARRPASSRQSRSGRTHRSAWRREPSVRPRVELPGADHHAQICSERSSGPVHCASPIPQPPIALKSFRPSPSLSAPSSHAAAPCSSPSNGLEHPGSRSPTFVE